MYPKNQYITHLGRKKLGQSTARVNCHPRLRLGWQTRDLGWPILLPWSVYYFSSHRGRKWHIPLFAPGGNGVLSDRCEEKGIIISQAEIIYNGITGSSTFSILGIYITLIIKISLFLILQSFIAPKVGIFPTHFFPCTRLPSLHFFRVPGYHHFEITHAHTHTHTHIVTHTHAYINIHTFMWVCLCVCVHLCLWIGLLRLYFIKECFCISNGNYKVLTIDFIFSPQNANIPILNMTTMIIDRYIISLIENILI